MAVIEINRHPSPRELRQFAGIGLPIFCAVLGAWRVYASGEWTLAGILWSLGVLGAVVGWLRPAWVRPLYVGWLYAVFPIGWTISHLILAVIYFLILTPIGLVVRWFRPDPLGLKLDRGRDTYWVSHDPGHDPKRYFRQF